MHRQFPAFRGIAIVLVVLNHTIHMGTKYPIENGYSPFTGWVHYLLTALLILGFFAVPIFLFLSGSFFAYAAGNKDIKSSYKIVWKNLPFIIIPYLIWSLLFYVEVYFLHEKTFSLSGWIKNLIVGYPYNFVPLLIFFYILSPLIAFLAKRIGWWLILFVGVYQLLLIGVIHPGAIGIHLPEYFNLIVPPVLGNSLADWAIFFPLGLVYILKMKQTQPILRRWKLVLVAIMLVLYILSVLTAIGVIDTRLAGYIFPVLLMLVMPTIQRNSIPWARQLELLGKRSYGLYLMNLLVIDLMLFVVQSFAPGLLAYALLLMPFIFVLTFIIPLAIMHWVERLPKPIVYRYIFG